jgi:hypothetical protein
MELNESSAFRSFEIDPLGRYSRIYNEGIIKNQSNYIILKLNCLTLFKGLKVEYQKIVLYNCVNQCIKHILSCD